MTFAILPFLISFIISITSLPHLITYLKKISSKGQPIRKDGPKSHLTTKRNIPTMGGLVILFSSIATTLIFAEINYNLLVMLFVTVSYALLGGLDDYKKLSKGNSKGIRPKAKLVTQLIIAIITITLLHNNGISTEISLPFCYKFDLKLFYYPLAVLLITSYSNAVNITDGLDGLVTFPIILAAGCLCLISFITIYNYEVILLGLTLMGSCLGFLFFNANPAKIFMGDAGSLSIGALLGTMSIIIKQEVIFIIITTLFVIEAFSVLIQVYYFKFTGGKRIFRMAPIHHHFELLGWQENTIVIRFWIFATLCAAVGISLA